LKFEALLNEILFFNELEKIIDGKPKIIFSVKLEIKQRLEVTQKQLWL